MSPYEDVRQASSLSMASQVAHSLKHRQAGSWSDIAFDINQSQVGFVDRRRGLRSMAWTFAAHMGLGQAMRFAAPGRSQFFQGGLKSGAPGKE